MAMKKQLWGFFENGIREPFFSKIADVHEELLELTRAGSRASRNYSSVLKFLKKVNQAPEYGFFDQFHHYDYLRKKCLVDAYALVGEWENSLAHYRDFFPEHGRFFLRVHYGEYRQYVSPIHLTGRDIYYCASKSWLIKTKRTELKEKVLAEFAKEVTRQSLTSTRNRGSANQRAAWQAEEMEAYRKRQNPGTLSAGEKVVTAICLLIVLSIILSWF